MIVTFYFLDGTKVEMSVQIGVSAISVFFFEAEIFTPGNQHIPSQKVLFESMIFRAFQGLKSRTGDKTVD